MQQFNYLKMQPGRLYTIAKGNLATYIQAKNGYCCSLLTADILHDK